MSHQSLTIVSNREPYTVERVDGETRLVQTTGGLVSALDPVMRSSRGRWVSWMPDSRGSVRKLQQELAGLELPYELDFVPVSQAEVRGYYRGFSNRALWPLCHYCLDRCHFDVDDWRHYQAVNERFADRVADSARRDQHIWVHDYQLCLVPELIRERMPDVDRISYFHHIPFPPPDVLRILPWYREVLHGLLGADLVGFHTASYAENFLLACRKLKGIRVDLQASCVDVDGRRVKVGAFPIGVDVDEFESRARRPEAAQAAREIRERMSADRIVLGVDRLDYSKGILERLAAFDLFLTEHPEQKTKVSLIQVAVPSRTNVPEYKSFKRRIDEAVGRINGKHGMSGWQPILYMYDRLAKPELIAHYLAADVALVTPICDGMNLVAKEYCASRIDEDGVLILSEFAGAAEDLEDGALLVNPRYYEQVVRALQAALTMPKDQRAARMRRMRAQVAGYNIDDWLQSILAVDTAPEAAESLAAEP
jgi:trehalose 6-phosphate synthase